MKRHRKKLTCYGPYDPRDFIQVKGRTQGESHNNPMNTSKLHIWMDVLKKYPNRIIGKYIKI